MTCAKCNRNLVSCICVDCDERINKLKNSPYLAIDFDAIIAQRFLNKFDTERDKQQTIVNDKNI